MPNPSFKNTIGISLIAVIFIMGSCVYAQEPRLEKNNPRQAANLTGVQEQARLYRDEGLKQQKQGNLDAAGTCYQKAVVLDPGYAVAYNDLGIIYEAKGLIGPAEANYLEAIRKDSGYLSAYSNLALLYENKGDLRKAVSFWEKRLEFGAPGDLWTEKAKVRLDELVQMIPELKADFIEKETINLIRTINEEKKAKKIKELEDIQNHFIAAKNFDNKHEYKDALKELDWILSLSPQDQQAKSLKGAIKDKLREQKKKTVMSEMQAYFQNGLNFYRYNDFRAAKIEFDKITRLTMSSQD